MIDNISNKTSAEISVDMDEKEKELVKVSELLSSIKQEKYRLQREKINLSGKIKDLEISEEKQAQRVRELSAELRIMKNLFWAARNSGT